MSDTQKSCIGFGALILGLGLAAVSLVAGGLGELVTYLGGDSLGINFRTGLIAGGVIFSLLFLTAVYFFIKVRDWSWFPAIISGVYTILPDVIPGPEDDVAAMILGIALSAGLSFFKTRYERRKAVERPELPPDRSK
jgi:hypothetical protein